MKTLASFIKQSSIAESIIRATVRQAGGWSSFKESAKDVSNHGAACGFHGFIYYVDTVKFAEKNLQALLSLVNEYAQEFGAKDACSLMAEWKGIDGMSAYEIYNALHCYNKKTGDAGQREQVLNCLAWFALEEVSRSYTDLSEQQ